MQNNVTTSFNPLWGWYPIAGAISMLIGGGIWGATGTDLWASLEENTMADYLKIMGNIKLLSILHTSFWTLGLLIIGMGGALMAYLCKYKPVIAKAALVCINTGVAIGVVAFITMLSLVVQIAPDTSATAVMVANTIGWIGAFADNLATVLVIGAGPFLLSLSGDREWIPKWLKYWGFLAGLVALLAIAGFYFSPLSEMVFLLIPVGMGWLIGAGIVIIKIKTDS